MSAEVDQLVHMFPHVAPDEVQQALRESRGDVAAAVEALSRVAQWEVQEGKGKKHKDLKRGRGRGRGEGRGGGRRGRGEGRGVGRGDSRGERRDVNGEGRGSRGGRRGGRDGRGRGRGDVRALHSGAGEETVPTESAAAPEMAAIDPPAPKSAPKAVSPPSLVVGGFSYAGAVKSGLQPAAPTLAEPAKDTQAANPLPREAQGKRQAQRKEGAQDRKGGRGGRSGGAGKQTAAPVPTAGKAIPEAEHSENVAPAGAAVVSATEAAAPVKTVQAPVKQQQPQQPQQPQAPQPQAPQQQPPQQQPPQQPQMSKDWGVAYNPTQSPVIIPNGVDKPASVTVQFGSFGLKEEQVSSPSKEQQQGQRSKPAPTPATAPQASNGSSTRSVQDNPAVPPQQNQPPPAEMLGGPSMGLYHRGMPPQFQQMIPAGMMQPGFNQHFSAPGGESEGDHQGRQMVEDPRGQTSSPTQGGMGMYQMMPPGPPFYQNAYPPYFQPNFQNFQSNMYKYGFQPQRGQYNSGAYGGGAGGAAAYGGMGGVGGAGSGAYGGATMGGGSGSPLGGQHMGATSYDDPNAPPQNMQNDFSKFQSRGSKGTGPGSEGSSGAATALPGGDMNPPAPAYNKVPSYMYQNYGHQYMQQPMMGYGQGNGMPSGGRSFGASMGAGPMGAGGNAGGSTGPPSGGWQGGAQGQGQSQ